MRVHIRGMRDVDGSRLTYVQETTGETDLDDPKRIALEKYDDLRLRVRDKKPANELTFHDMDELWWAEKKQEPEVSYRAKGRSGKTQRILWYEMYARRYWLPYFGEFKIDLLDQKMSRATGAGGSTTGNRRLMKSVKNTATTP